MAALERVLPLLVILAGVGAAIAAGRMALGGADGWGLVGIAGVALIGFGWNMGRPWSAEADDDEG